MHDYKESVMVALLPITTDWSKITLPHLTLVYAGLVFDLNEHDHNEMLKSAADVAFKNRPVQLQVLAVEVFGRDEEKVDVLRLRSSPQLLLMRRRLEGWNASEFPFNPHVTVGPVGSFDGNMPPALAFDRIMVAWGEQQTTFWLRP